MLSATETPLFDPVAVDRLRAVAGDEDLTFVAEMAHLFVEESTKSLRDLQAACDKGDWRAVSRLSHSLKSASATFGLMRLSNALVALELNTKDGTSDSQTAALATSVHDEFERSLPVVKELA